MRRLVLLVVVACTGCSTAPLAGFLDTVAPAKVRLDPIAAGPPADPFLAPPTPNATIGPTAVPPVTIPPTSFNTVAPPTFTPAPPPPVSADPPSPWAPRTPLLPGE